mmetsp:Transcript_57121/g.85073  ORF Transcript_57121/g.85073 Transcript_57121/m.85073 type:complete len:207 (+) Transcript_57121:104-724(+)
MNQHENQEQRQQLNKQTPSLPPHYVHIDPQSDSSIPQRRYSKKMEPHSNSNGANVIVAIPTDANLSSLKQRRQHSRSENNIIYYEQQRQLMHQIDEQERKLYNEAELYDLRHKSHHHHHHHPSHIHVTLPKKGASRALWIPRGFYWFFPLAVAQWVVHSLQSMFYNVKQYGSSSVSKYDHSHQFPNHHQNQHHHHHHHHHHRCNTD